MAEQDVITSEKPKLTPDQLVVHDEGEYAMLFDTARFNQAYRIATAFADSGLVPDHFKKNPAGVFVVLHMATRMQLDPFMVLQKTYMVHGRPGMEAQLVIALVNARGPFTGPIQWRFEGEGKDRKCTAYATHAKTGELCEAVVTWAMVEAEGWNKKAGSKWLTLERLMFQYRSATFLARLYCPEVIMGLSTADELEDTLITLDSGIEISKKPRAIPPVPEPNEATLAAIADFDRQVSEKNLTPERSTCLEKFLGAYPNYTPGQVKTRASADFPEFWKVFEEWEGKQSKTRKERADKGTTRKPTTPPDAPQGDAGARGGGEGEGKTTATTDPQAATDEQRQALEIADRENPEGLKAAWQESGVSPAKLIPELSFDEADAILGALNQ